MSRGRRSKGTQASHLQPVRGRADPLRRREGAGVGRAPAGAGVRPKSIAIVNAKNQSVDYGCCAYRDLPPHLRILSQTLSTLGYVPWNEARRIWKRAEMSEADGHAELALLLLRQSPSP